MHNYSPCSKNPPSSLAFIPRALFRQYPLFRLANRERVRGHFFGVRGALLPASSNMRLIRHEKCHRRERSRDEGGRERVLFISAHYAINFQGVEGLLSPLYAYYYYYYYAGFATLLAFEALRNACCLLFHRYSQ